MLIVKPRKNETIAQLIKRFKNKCIYSGLIDEIQISLKSPEEKRSLKPKLKRMAKGREISFY